MKLTKLKHRPIQHFFQEGMGENITITRKNDDSIFAFCIARDEKGKLRVFKTELEELSISDYEEIEKHRFEEQWWYWEELYKWMQGAMKQNPNLTIIKED